MQAGRRAALVTREPRSIDLPTDVIDDRVRRYLGPEPLAAIAADHGVGVAAILHTVKRHAPSCYGSRPRGPRPSWVEADW